MHRVVRGCRHENGAICATHGCVKCLTVCDLHHASRVWMLKIAKVKLQAFGQTFHAVHVEKLLEVILSAGVHGVTLVIPSCGLHHDHREGQVPAPRR